MARKWYFCANAIVSSDRSCTLFLCPGIFSRPQSGGTSATESTAEWPSPCRTGSEVTGAQTALTRRPAVAQAAAAVPVCASHLRSRLSCDGPEAGQTQLPPCPRGPVTRDSTQTHAPARGPHTAVFPQRGLHCPPFPSDAFTWARATVRVPGRVVTSCDNPESQVHSKELSRILLLRTAKVRAGGPAPPERGVLLESLQAWTAPCHSPATPTATVGLLLSHSSASPSLCCQRDESYAGVACTPHGKAGPCGGQPFLFCKGHRLAA